MSAKIISLAAYRDGLELDGLTLVWRGYRHALTPDEALRLAECLQEARVMSGQWEAAGFVIDSKGARVLITGWDMGPAKLNTPGAIAKLTLALARAGKEAS